MHFNLYYICTELFLAADVRGRLGIDILDSTIRSTWRVTVYSYSIHIIKILTFTEWFEDLGKNMYVNLRGSNIGSSFMKYSNISTL